MAFIRSDAQGPSRLHQSTRGEARYQCKGLGGRTARRGDSAERRAGDPQLGRGGGISSAPHCRWRASRVPNFALSPSGSVAVSPAIAKEGMDLAPPLPDDVLAGVLRRLAPRGLAVSRCICKAWRRVVDDRRLLRADLLPRSLGNEAILEEKFVWDSDSDNVLEPESRSKDSFIDFLGFHPYKEVVFLSDKFDRVLAYNWSSSKIQDLGKVFPKFYIDWDLHFHHKYVSASFPYTPCWLGELPEKLNLEAQLED
ncbi:unnamed protein product [Miscanthus lutarioriparius]|uniref:F-box domain-containing protein n=1 Tax=Miscanthus lutarioriparius TaxID=422564 RepID=A0A811PN93_9POAL|nr:unnamed protein product [Miscanthus lutarioriparius]